MFSNSFSRATLALLALSLAIFPGFGCAGGTKEAKTALEQVTLTYWRVFDDSDTFSDIISAYRQMHPNVRIDYKKLRYDEYQKELIQAFAEDRGPDIFSVQNAGIKGMLPLIMPMPDTVKIAYQETKGTIKKETIVVLRTEPTLSIRSLNDQFVQVVSDDVIYPVTQDGETKNRIHGLPLSVDSLALYYNRDLLDAAGIPEPPKTWGEFKDAIIKLTKYDAKGKIAQSGAAIGYGSNIDRSSDILSLLMMQIGARLSDARGFATFAEKAPGERVAPAVDAVRFYTDFANPTKEVYTWSPSFTSSFDAFAAGQTAFFFGYSYHSPLLKTRSPKLRFAVSVVPQLEGGKKANIANYWIETVSKKTKNPDWAWDFVQFAAKAEQAKLFLAKAKKPTALRSVVLGQLDDATLAPFADQVLTAEDWYNGKDPIAADKIMEQMIDDIVDGTQLIEDAIKNAQSAVNQTI